MSQTRSPLPYPLCENLCAKRLMMLSEGHVVALEDLQTAGYETYWCQHTMTDTGPDGGWVMYDRCAPGRECYRDPAAAEPAG
jgi:hypothetical protein